MSFTLGKFDKSGSFFATITSRQGKKEVCISPIQKEGDEIFVSETLAVSFDLAEDQDVACFEWIYADSAVNGKSKRRLSSNGSVSQESKSDSYLAVALNSGNILIFSPFHKDTINEIQIDDQVTALASTGNSFWVSTSKDIKEFTLNGSEPKTSIEYPDYINQVSSLHTLKFNFNNYLIVGGNSIIIIIDSSKNEVIGQFSSAEDKPQTPVNHITSINDTIIFAKEGSKTITGFSLITQEQLFTLKSSAQIVSLSTVDQSIAVINSKGEAQIFKDPKTAEAGSKIKSNNKNVQFISATSYASQLLLGWIDIAPKFKLVSLKRLKALTEIDVHYAPKQKQNGTKAKIIETVAVDLEADEELNIRETDLPSLISKNLNDPHALLLLLVSNQDQDKMKYVVSKITRDVAVKVYNILSARITSHPTESAVLNNWLKWVLVSNAQHINATANFKPLKSSLAKNLKDLPTLLGLQGRLELLQSQLQLRAQIAAGEVFDSELPVDLVAKAEENIKYINGENDDGDYVIEAGGNSESDEDDEENEEEGSADDNEQESDEEDEEDE